jgi:hypothetical protein
VASDESPDRWLIGDGDLRSGVERCTADESQGAVLQIEVELDSLITLRQAGLAREEEDARLRTAWDLVLGGLPEGTTGRRAGWKQFEYVLRGEREVLASLGHRLLRSLRAEPSLAGLQWHLLLIEIYPESPERTLMCDPGYDVADVEGSFVAWVEPYRGDDWRASQKYPLVHFLDEPS